MLPKLLEKVAKVSARDEPFIQKKGRTVYLLG